MNGICFGGAGFRQPPREASVGGALPHKARDRRKRPRLINSSSTSPKLFAILGRRIIAAPWPCNQRVQESLVGHFTDKRPPAFSYELCKLKSLGGWGP